MYLASEFIGAKKQLDPNQIKILYNLILKFQTGKNKDKIIVREFDIKKISKDFEIEIEDVEEYINNLNKDIIIGTLRKDDVTKEIKMFKEIKFYKSTKVFNVILTEEFKNIIDVEWHKSERIDLDFLKSASDKLEIKLYEYYILFGGMKTRKFTIESFNKFFDMECSVEKIEGEIIPLFKEKIQNVSDIKILHDIKCNKDGQCYIGFYNRKNNSLNLSKKALELHDLILNYQKYEDFVFHKNSFKTIFAQTGFEKAWKELIENELLIYKRYKDENDKWKIKWNVIEEVQLDI